MKRDKNGWFNARDGLPENDDEVLVIVWDGWEGRRSNLPRIMSGARYNTFTKSWYPQNSDDSTDWIYGDVTHWQPLPEFPEELLEDEDEPVDVPHASPDEAEGAPALHVYLVGMGTGTALVEAPSAFAAALLYRASIQTNAPLGAVVYEVDGVKFEGPQPWISWQLNWKQMDSREQEGAIALIEQATTLIPFCRFVEPGE
jgi:hypothetical protein